MRLLREFSILQTYKLIEAFPVVLRHKSKGTEQRPAEVVEVRVAVIRVRTGDYARVIGRALSARQSRPRDIRCRCDFMNCIVSQYSAFD